MYTYACSCVNKQRYIHNYLQDRERKIYGHSVPMYLRWCDLTSAYVYKYYMLVYLCPGMYIYAGTPKEGQIKSIKLDNSKTRADIPRKDRHMKHVGVDSGLRRVVMTSMRIQVFEFLGSDQFAHGSPIGEHLCTSRHEVTST